MTRNDRINRRSALQTAIVLGASGTLFFLRDVEAASSKSHVDGDDKDVASPIWPIRAGSGIGPILLGIEQQEVTAILGDPQDTLDFPGASAEQLCEALGEIYDPEVHYGVAPRFFLKYLDAGFSVEIMEGVVSEINAFTGHLSGYEKGDYAPFQGHFESNLFTLVSTKNAITGAIGVPCREGHNEHATIPQDWLHYYRIGIKFAFNAETNLLSCVSLCPAS